MRRELRGARPRPRCTSVAPNAQDPARLEYSGYRDALGRVRGAEISAPRCKAPRPVHTSFVSERVVLDRAGWPRSRDVPHPALDAEALRRLLRVARPADTFLHHGK